MLCYPGSSRLQYCVLCVYARTFVSCFSDVFELFENKTQVAKNSKEEGEIESKGGGDQSIFTGNKNGKI
jgi:hypothetical protein